MDFYVIIDALWQLVTNKFSVYTVLSKAAKLEIAYATLILYSTFKTLFSVTHQSSSKLMTYLAFSKVSKFSEFFTLLFLILFSIKDFKAFRTLFGKPAIFGSLLRNVTTQAVLMSFNYLATDYYSQLLNLYG